ncbi:hypothetical protein Sme01_11550 [Sphaerisporangium melleum]|uniref:Uncharacterized protein n=1 Tax=Sphaerisporangium melleum TaxID=321316 RepID=A0A917RHN0_9ACTN|nr:hypothetical protein GCM10007964_57230 [Sphaerisporangium melleum]GII68679.1 hypothetical protein Sme01_11550 [Sphaerisporangium melleum]
MILSGAFRSVIRRAAGVTGLPLLLPVEITRRSGADHVDVPSLPIALLIAGGVLLLVCLMLGVFHR